MSRNRSNFSFSYGSSDADGDLLTFVWSFTSRPDGNTATLSDLTIVNPTFAADFPGTYTIQLIVNDRTADSDPDSVVIGRIPKKWAKCILFDDRLKTYGQTIHELL